MGMAERGNHRPFADSVTPGWLAKRGFHYIVDDLFYDFCVGSRAFNINKTIIANFHRQRFQFCPARLATFH